MGDVIELARWRGAATANPHIQTWRPYTMLYVGLVGLAGALLAGGADGSGALVVADAAGSGARSVDAAGSADAAASVVRLCGAWLVPTLGWIAGHYGGDYFDRRLDAAAKPHRPIPSGRMPARVALAGMIVCSAVGGVLAVLLNWRALLLVGVALTTGIAYSVVFKSRGFPGNLVRGSLTSLAFLFGAMAVREHPPPVLLVVAAVFLLHDTASNLVGTLRDVEGDRASGCGTFAVRHGAAPTIVVVVALCVGWIALAALSPLALAEHAAQPGPFYGLLLVAAGLVVTALATLTQDPGPPRPRTALRAHETLTLERVVLASAFAGLAAGLPVALGLAIPAVVLSLMLQTSMRYEYEFGTRRPVTTGRRA